VECDVKSKLEVITRWCKELSISLNQVAYVGDDRNDLEVMKAVGLCACPADAQPEAKAAVHWILEAKGGEGCVREFVDLFLPG
jgi:3-deoxy-D-manno-octulosonate 8-phosphate phosphatase (KDO 8-P phosphatase)